MKPYFPENWSHSLAQTKSWGDMEEGSSAQPFEAHWDGLVALISSSIFESDGFVIPEILSVPQQLESSAFTQSSAFNCGEKLEDTTRAE